MSISTYRTNTEIGVTQGSNHLQSLMTKKRLLKMGDLSFLALQEWGREKVLTFVSYIVRFFFFPR